MKKLIAMVALVVALGLRTAAGAPLYIRNVNLIDGTGSGVQSGRNVLIDEGRIRRISASTDAVPRGAVVIDGSQLFLIPGLWDMHVHWYDQRFLPLFIANGVTGVRQMWGLDPHYAWRARQNDPAFIAPKQLIASAILDGAPKIWPGSIEVTDPAAAREHVQGFQRRGADFIKVYSRLSREVYFAIADESKRLGIPFAGHVPVSISVSEAAAAGQKSIEHLTMFDTAFVKDPAALEAKFAGLPRTPENLLARQEEILRSQDEVKLRGVLQTLIDHGTWQVPTLTVLRNGAFLRERAELDKERLAYLPKSVTAEWLPENNPRARSFTDERQWRTAQVRFSYQKRVVGEMHRAGVGILAGTDVLNPFCFPGFSLHDELELLVESGLHPMAALQAATFNAAEFAGKLNDFGTVAVGKVADLVLLSANPLVDIRNTTKIRAVVLNGVLHDRKALDGMLASSRRQAGEGR